MNLTDFYVSKICLVWGGLNVAHRLLLSRNHHDFTEKLIKKARRRAARRGKRGAAPRGAAPRFTRVGRAAPRGAALFFFLQSAAPVRAA